ncbi:MAG: agmatinase [Candidatus Aenigmatarchaeota archaeon]
MLYLRKTFSYEYPLEKADVVLAGVPFDGTETGKSVRYGPLFVREAIRNVPGYDPKLKTNVFDRVKFADIGDVEVVPGSWDLTEERIMETVKWIFETNPDVFPVFIGGEHLITLGILKAIKEFLREKITVLHFDAHRDLLPEYIGERFSHITWAYHLLREGGFRIVQIGCRSWSKEEEKIMRDFGVSDRIEKIQGHLYLTVDLDVFDPACAPEVGTPEPEGINLDEFFGTFKKSWTKNIIGMDIVECASDRVNTQTAVLAAHIFKKIIGMRMGR